MPDLRVTFRWQRHPGGRHTEALREVAAEVLRHLKVEAAEVGVLLCDDATIRALNCHFRGKDSSTDVLSFPANYAQPEGPPYLGDVAISVETAARQAARAATDLETELKVLVLHAVVHLCGYDHETDRGEMRRLEKRLRRGLIR